VKIKNVQSIDSESKEHSRQTKIKQKHNTMRVGYHYAKTNTNNVSKR